MIAFISVLYNGSDPSTYQGMRLQIGDDEARVINTGDPTVDFLTAGILVDRHVGTIPIMGSSSIDHFEFDGGTVNYGNPSPEQMAKARDNADSYPW